MILKKNVLPTKGDVDVCSRVATYIILTHLAQALAVKKRVAV